MSGITRRKVFLFYQLTDGISEKKKSHACPVFYIQEELSLYTRTNGRRSLKALLKKMNYVDTGCRTAARHSGPSVTAVSKWKKCKWNKIKENCFTTPAPASQSELAHLDKCQRYQMAFPPTLESHLLFNSASLQSSEPQNYDVAINGLVST